jgi:molybdate transport system ATP-binding protein
VSDRRLSASLRQTGPIPLDVEFACDPGRVLAIFGPSGAGKTTILRAIAGLNRPASALVQSGDDVWTDTASGRFVPPHRRTVGFVFQEYALFPHLGAAGNVMTALGHLPRAERRGRARDLLAMVHLAGRERKRPDELSGGERQRVALARALARDPSVLLLDEPFAAVDRAIRRHLQDEIDTLRRHLHIPLVLVTHDFDDVLRLATDVLLLEAGRMVASGPLTTVASRPELTWLQAAVGLGAVLEATVTRTDADRGLTEIAFDGGTLLISRHELSAGSKVRIRIPAREVILASAVPHGLSVHNVLPATVAAIGPAGGGAVTVQLAVGASRFLAEVTRDAIARLRIERGSSVFALVKSVSVEVVAETRTDAGPDGGAGLQTRPGRV